jgi:hypothetical protein
VGQFDVIRSALESAIGEVIAKEAALLQINAGEQAIAHHLANYLRQALQSQLNVDVEYNKHRTGRKVLLLPTKGDPSGIQQQTIVRPDIIVHRRGDDEANLLVIEVKKPSQDLERDRQKLYAFKDQLGYQYAAHVILGRLDEKPVGEIRWIE